MHHQHINMGYGLKHMFRMAYCFAVHRKSTIHLRAEIVMVFLAFILMEFLLLFSWSIFMSQQLFVVFLQYIYVKWKSFMNVFMWQILHAFDFCFWMAFFFIYALKFVGLTIDAHVDFWIKTFVINDTNQSLPSCGQ